MFVKYYCLAINIENFFVVTMIHFNTVHIDSVVAEQYALEFPVQKFPSNRVKEHIRGKIIFPNVALFSNKCLCYQNMNFNCRDYVEISRARFHRNQIKVTHYTHWKSRITPQSVALFTNKRFAIKTTFLKNLLFRFCWMGIKRRTSSELSRFSLILTQHLIQQT